MEKRFIAFFDYLGFKQFIENNDIETQKKVMGDIQRDIEQSLVLEKDGKRNNKIIGNSTVIADLSHIKLNSILFSDTVIFWSTDDTFESLENLLRCCFDFNSKTNCFFFPARGAIIYDYIKPLKFDKTSKNRATYNINSVYGIGVVKAYEKAESQNWAGTVIDSSIIEYLENKEEDANKFLSKYAKKYLIPYKKEVKNQKEEFVLNFFTSTISETLFENTSKNIKDNFSKHNKNVNNSVQAKIDNTIKFLESCIKIENNE